MNWSWKAFDELELRELYALMALRQEVFVVEQDCAYLDADGLDERAMHLLGYAEDGHLGAYVRAFGPSVISPEMVIGRVITSSRMRGSGLGRPLMREAMRRCVDQWGIGPIALSAQSHLEGFYGSLGFVVCGEGYLEDGIPHVPMRREG